jgi:alpha-mannosidase
VKRNIKLPSDNYVKKELEVDTKSQQSWTAICDNKRGLAIISPGQYETAVSDEPSNPIKLTLFRSFRKTVMTNGQTDCQLLKKFPFKYNIVPIKQNFDRQRLFIQAAKLANWIKTVQFDLKEIKYINPAEKLPASSSFINLTGAVLTGICKYNNKIEIRFFNPDENVNTAILKISDEILKNKFTKAWRTDFLGNKKENPYPIENNEFRIDIKPKEIITLTLE